MENSNEVINHEEDETTEFSYVFVSDIHPLKDLVVKVQNPQTVREQGKPKYINFQLSVEHAGEIFPLDQSDHVRRSFQDFIWLREILTKRHGDHVIPELHGNHKLANKVKFYYVVKQQKYLCDFTEACFKQENLLLDPVFCLFFQSDLTINELEDFTSGNVDDDFLTKIWEKNGITKIPEIDYWDKVTSDEYYEEVICKQNTEQPN